LPLRDCDTVRPRSLTGCAKMFCPKCGKELPEESQFCLKCGYAIAGGKPGAASARPAKPSRTLLWILLAIAAVVCVWAITQLSDHSSRSLPPIASSAPLYTPPAPVLVPATQNLFTGQITVKPGGYVTNTFTVQPGMLNFHVVGQFSASGGLGNDIQVVLADPNQFQDWINGHQATVFYSTNKETTEHFDIGPLGPGQYIFAFSNKFSIFAEKQVFAQVDANWQTSR
jgi:hypothetical protein